jgi:hypothetical protein
MGHSKTKREQKFNSQDRRSQNQVDDSFVKKIIEERKAAELEWESAKSKSSNNKEKDEQSSVLSKKEQRRLKKLEKKNNVPNDVSVNTISQKISDISLENLDGNESFVESLENKDLQVGSAAKGKF